MLKPRLIPLFALCALAAGCDHNHSINTPDGYIRVLDGRITLWANDAPKASIDQAGALSVDDKAIAVDDHQRELLHRYYASATAVRQHGIETGKAGAAMADEALKGVKETISGDESAVNKRIEAQTRKITDHVLLICDDLAGIKSVQDELATSLPAFQPYRGIISEKTVSDCRNDNKHERKN